MPARCPTAAAPSWLLPDRSGPSCWPADEAPPAEAAPVSRKLAPTRRMGRPGSGSEGWGRMGAMAPERVRPARPHHKLTEDGRRMREVLTYARRGSRFTPRQQEAWSAYAERWWVPDEAVDDPG